MLVRVYTEHRLSFYSILSARASERASGRALTMFATRGVVVHALRRSFLRITLGRGAGQRSHAICPTTVPSLIHYQPLASRAHEASDRRAGADLTPFGRVSSAYLCFHRSFAHVCALKHWRKITYEKCEMRTLFRIFNFVY